MLSIHKCSNKGHGAWGKGMPALIVLAILAGGCQRAFNTRYTTFSRAPIPEDQAMQRREWPQTTTPYANGATAAFSTGFLWEPRPNMPEWKYQFTVPAMFVGMTIMLPVTLVRDDVRQERLYHGVAPEPTSHAMPAVAPVP